MMQPRSGGSSSSPITYIQATFGWLAGLASNWLASWLGRYVFVGALTVLLIVLIPIAVYAYKRHEIEGKGLNGAIWGFMAGILSSLIANLSQDTILSIGTPLITFLALLLISIGCLRLSQQLPNLRQLLTQYFWYRILFAPGIVRDIFGGLLGTLMFIVINFFLLRYFEDNVLLVLLGIGLFVNIAMGAAAALVSGRPYGFLFSALLSEMGVLIYLNPWLQLTIDNSLNSSDFSDNVFVLIIILLFIIVYYIILPIIGAILVSSIVDGWRTNRPPTKMSWVPLAILIVAEIFALGTTGYSWLRNSCALLSTTPTIQTSERSKSAIIPTNVSHLVLDWCVPDVGYATSPVVNNGIVYVSNGSAGDGMLYAFDPSTGNTLWTYSGIYPSTFGGLSFIVANGMIYSYTRGGYVIALNTKTGQTVWSTNISVTESNGYLYAPYLNGLAVANNIVYVNIPNDLYAINARTGQMLWSTMGPASGLAIANGIVYADGSNKLYAINALTGEKLWTTALASPGVPVITNSAVYVDSDKLYAFHARTGELMWTAPVTGDSIVLVAADGNIYATVGRQDDEITAFNAQTGQYLWTHNFNTPNITGPLVANGIVYIGSSDKLYAIDDQTGQMLWTFPSGDKFLSSPTIANGIVYAASDKLYALDAESGKNLWNYPIVGSEYSSPTIVNDMLFVCSGNGRLYAFRLPLATR